MSATAHDGHGTKPASEQTARVNQEALARYAMDDRQDFVDVDRGLIAAFPDRLYDSDGVLIYDGTLLGYADDDVDAPPSVNPSLWRQAQLNKRMGALYEVVTGLYQVR